MRKEEGKIEKRRGQVEERELEEEVEAVDSLRLVPLDLHERYERGSDQRESSVQVQEVQARKVRRAHVVERFFLNWITYSTLRDSRHPPRPSLLYFEEEPAQDSTSLNDDRSEVSRLNLLLSDFSEDFERDH